MMTMVMMTMLVMTMVRTMMRKSLELLQRHSEQCRHHVRSHFPRSAKNIMLFVMLMMMTLLLKSRLIVFNCDSHLNRMLLVAEGLLHHRPNLFVTDFQNISFRR